MRVYFLTGATGSVGAAIVPKLAELEQVRIYMLIRAADEEALRDRFDSLMRFWGFNERRVSSAELIPVRGDLVSPSMGMEKEAYDRLASECTHIIHASGNVRLNLPLEEARCSAAGSLRQVIALAMDSGEGFQKIELISTVGVGGISSEPLREEALPARGRKFHNTYEQAKAEAEDLAFREMARTGLPVTVHRPSMVVGDSRTGDIINFKVFYHICEFLAGRRTRGVVPDLSGYKLDVVPSDYVAAAVVHSSTSVDTAGKVLHLCSGPEGAVDLKDLTLLSRSIFRDPSRLRMVPLPLLKGVIPFLPFLVPAGSRTAIRTLPLFLRYLEDRQVFENFRTRAVLENAGIPLPPPKSYLATVLQEYEHRRT